MSKGILFQLEEKETYVRAFYRAKTGEGEKEKKRNDDKRKDGKSKKWILRKDTKLSYSFFSDVENWDDRLEDMREDQWVEKKYQGNNSSNGSLTFCEGKVITKYRDVVTLHGL